ncbi:DUF2798 domain-containing protein [Roseibium salinum]|uniref:DUF2798 domain-containing protein n=1 Tax=Roseibium salinum TaxID=1604349 RepID=A0ABT3R2H6_9HYPH|nr:DUF2798 domain-containing protein [Roseibium sp. DSM 29163]MCX2723340.1 DUF2798 domain-containing protein [Roseibium sp. DSM 29163]
MTKASKIPRRYAGLLMGLLMALSMGLIMSFVVTVINLGLRGDFLVKWMIAYAGSLPIGLPTALLVTPIVKSIVDRMTE